MKSPALTFVPVGLRAPDAARYVGLGETKFREWVKRGLMPKPRKQDDCVIWDSEELAIAFRALPRDGEQVSSLDGVTL